MTTKLTVLIAAMCMSAGVFAQTQAPSKPTTSGTTNTGTPAVGESTNNSGEQNSTAMQNNSNTQNTTMPNKARNGKMNKSSKSNMDCNDAHTDGHASSPTSAGMATSTTANANCDNTNGKTKR
jgi:hypothetical protein